MENFLNFNLEYHKLNTVKQISIESRDLYK